MKFKLNQLAVIQTGIYRKPELYGDTLYLQAKHFDANGNLHPRIILKGELKSDKNLNKHLLKNGDIIFAAKGEKNFAFLFPKDLGNAVASSTFFIIRIKNKKRGKITPEFLHWYLNHPFTLAKLKNKAKGSVLPVISIKDLQNLEIEIPPQKVQEKIHRINKTWLKEKLLIEEIISKKDKFYQTILYRWAKGDRSNDGTKQPQTDPARH